MKMKEKYDIRMKVVYTTKLLFLLSVQHRSHIQLSWNTFPHRMINVSTHSSLEQQNTLHLYFFFFFFIFILIYYNAQNIH